MAKKLLYITIDYINKTDIEDKTKEFKGRRKGTLGISYRLVNMDNKNIPKTDDFLGTQDNKMDNFGDTIALANGIFCYDFKVLEKALRKYDIEFGENPLIFEFTKIFHSPNIKPTLADVYKGLTGNNYTGTTNANYCDTLVTIGNNLYDNKFIIIP